MVLLHFDKYRAGFRIQIRKDPHYFEKLEPDPYPHDSEKLDADPHESKNLGVEAQNGAADAHNGVVAQNIALEGLKSSDRRFARSGSATWYQKLSWKLEYFGII